MLPGWRISYAGAICHHDVIPGKSVAGVLSDGEFLTLTSTSLTIVRTPTEIRCYRLKSEQFIPKRRSYQSVTCIQPQALVQRHGRDRRLVIYGR